MNTIVIQRVMENSQFFYKIGPKPSCNTSNIQSEFEFYSMGSPLQSGMEMNVNAEHVQFQTVTPHEDKPTRITFQPQTNTMSSSKRVKRSKTSKQSSSKQLEQPSLLDRQKPEMQRLIRIREMVKLFYDKATLNSVLRKPIAFNPFQNIFSQDNKWFFQDCKIEIHHNAINAIYVAKLIFIAIYFFIFPLAMLYPEISESPFLLALKFCGIAFSLYDCFQTFQKTYSLDNNYTLNQEKYLYFRQEKRFQILLELFILLSTVLSVIFSHINLTLSDILFLSFCLNLSHFVQQLHRLEDQYLTATYLLKYWSLFKVIIKNIFVCHLLACTLIAVSYLSKGENWMTPSNIDQLVWYQQYIWSYYFGTTIILTIGFGDLHPNNTTQAFFIIVISFCACVFFGYNINYIGNLINSIKQEENEKNTKLKLLSSLSKKSNVSKNIHDEISRYIIEESKIKQEFNYAEEKKLLKELPESLRSSFLQEANEKIFNQLRQMIPLSNSTIEKLSLKIEAHFCHPDQMIKGPESQQNLIILQSGEVGFITRSKYPSKLRNVIIERINSSMTSQSKLVCADILLNEPLNYDIKSLDYSIIYEMDKAAFEESIIESKKDYQVYRELLDRCKFKLNEFALVKCRYCENKLHSLFECPKLHYLPFRKTLPLKSTNPKINSKQERISFERSKKLLFCEIIVQKTERDIDTVLSEPSTIGPQGMQPLVNRQGKREKRSSSKARSSCFRFSNDNMMNTMRMVTQLRDDIKNLKRNSFTNFEFNLWANGDCDQACNFQHYFSKFNPDILGEKEIKNTLMSRTNRIKRKPKALFNN